VRAEVVVVELVGGTDFNRGHGKRIEHGHNRRHDYKRERARSVP
jgi:hypothetical protein